MEFYYIYRLKLVRLHPIDIEVPQRLLIEPLFYLIRSYLFVQRSRELLLYKEHLIDVLFLLYEGTPVAFY
jgi:hypothetical protein